jgi:hypothetical protein
MVRYPQQGIGFTLNCVTLNGVSKGRAFTVFSNGQYVPLKTTCANIWGRGSRVPRKFYFSTRRGAKRHSSVGISTRYGLDGQGFESRWGQDFQHPSRPALGPTQPPIQVPGHSGEGVKRGVDHPTFI